MKSEVSLEIRLIPARKSLPGIVRLKMSCCVDSETQRTMFVNNYKLAYKENLMYYRY